MPSPSGRELLREVFRYARERWRRYFPDLLSQSAFNRRSRDLSGVLSHLIGVVAQQLGAYAAPYEVLDCVPVPLMRRCRGRRRRLFGAEAAIGKGGSDPYGCKLLLSVTAEGLYSRACRYRRPLAGRGSGEWSPLRADDWGDMSDLQARCGHGTQRDLCAQCRICQGSG